jgi:hypothetical protein
MPQFFIWLSNQGCEVFCKRTTLFGLVNYYFLLSFDLALKAHYGFVSSS